MWIPSVLVECLLRVHSVEQVCHYVVGNFFGSLVGQVHKVGKCLPELLYGTLHLVKHRYHVGLLHCAISLAQSSLLCRTQPCCTTSPAVVRQHLLGYLIVVGHLGVETRHLVPCGRAAHQLHHVAPLLGVTLTQGLRP